MPNRHLFVLILSSFIVGACTSLVSGDRPIAVKATDRPKLEKAIQLPLDAPFLPARIDGKRLQIYKVAFDGTLNDRTRIPEGERETIIARIARIVNADDYRAGAGMQGAGINALDAMTGASSATIAEAAAAKKFQNSGQFCRVVKPMRIDVSRALLRNSYDF